MPALPVGAPSLTSRSSACSCASLPGTERSRPARIGQLQLAQPVLTMLWSVILLNERVTMGMALAAGAVLASVALTQRMIVLRPN